MTATGDEFRKQIKRSREQAKLIFAERRHLDPDDVEAMMGEYDAESQTIEWLCWERGTLRYEDREGRQWTR